LGRTPRPSPCTRRVWVPRTVARAACTPATPRRPRAVIGRRSHARRRPVRRTPAMPRPIPGLASTWCPSHRLNRLELSYKAGRSSPRASTEPPSSAIGALTVNSTPACFSSQTCDAPHSTRTPCSPALACCPARAAGSPEPVSLRPPPGSHRRAPLPARSPRQPTVSAHSLGPSEAARATR
jgi:hypothetical protein